MVTNFITFLHCKNSIFLFYKVIFYMIFSLSKVKNIQNYNLCQLLLYIYDNDNA